MSQDQSDKNWVDTSASFAPAVIGAAAGVVVGDLMHRDARRPVAFALAAIGLCALVPSVVEIVVDKVNGPQSRRGSQRTLRSIRDAGVSGNEFPDLEDEMFIG
ncbi:hypothetical protein HW115_12635 [Verrucomicrobiaceae bacterium N1E253]|uniref:Uncharacterized protein n=1 Tax=Oceaniferula marina TaxID=2748318 RepID=A0A851GKU6_9BACT|nr:hypothetical protein [Oceaniferula marina]NWK56461.1 hypothetical protein [Oceaniferula marina]